MTSPHKGGVRMNTASLELSKELYELSSWETEDWHTNPEPGPEHSLPANYTVMIKIAPRYDLGYLLRKLPDYAKVLKRNEREEPRWSAGAITLGAGSNYINGHIWYYADTPEDAATKLAIKLFEHGVLKSMPSNHKGGGE